MLDVTNYQWDLNSFLTTFV